jgi:hypothetical protein
MMNLAYRAGQAKAEEDFGVRTAGDAYQRALPHGDMRVSAERLAKTLTGRWGSPTSPYGVGASSFDYSGIGRDGAAL